MQQMMVMTERTVGMDATNWGAGCRGVAQGACAEGGGVAWVAGRVCHAGVCLGPCVAHVVHISFLHPHPPPHPPSHSPGALALLPAVAGSGGDKRHAL